MAKILVVDDDADIRRVLTSILMESGHQVLTAENGMQALQVVREQSPDVMVLDVMMPRLDGFDVLKEMKSEGIRDHTKVLLLTAKSAEQDWARGYKLGADHYLTKPFGIDELSAAVEQVIAMSPEQLNTRRERELGKAQLLSKLESLFPDA